MVWALMIVSALVGGIIQPLTGFGSAVILIAVASYFFDITVAPTIVAAICMFQSGVMAWSMRKSVDFRQILPLIALYTVCSLVAINLLGSLDLHLLTAAFGIFLILLSLYFLFVAKRVSLKPKLSTGILCSAFSGVCAGLFTIGGPMMALYFVATSKDKKAYVANMQFLFATTNIINVAMRTVRGYFPVTAVPMAAVCVVFILLGTRIGTNLSKKMSGNVARQIVYIGVGISGLVTTLQQLL